MLRVPALKFDKTSVKMLSLGPEGKTLEQVPESPNSCSTTLVADLFQVVFHLDAAPPVDRSHRSLQPGQKTRTRPQDHYSTFIIRELR